MSARRYSVLVFLFALLSIPVSGRAAISGNGQTVFHNVPVPPGSFPDYARSAFALKGGPHTRPQAFNFGMRASADDVIDWYRSALPRLGWHVRQVRRSYPAKQANAIIADRAGEAVTVIVLALDRSSTRVNVIKLVSSE